MNTVDKIIGMNRSYIFVGETTRESDRFYLFTDGKAETLDSYVIFKEDPEGKLTEYSAIEAMMNLGLDLGEFSKD